MDHNFDLKFNKAQIPYKIITDDKAMEKKTKSMYFTKQDSMFNMIKDFTLDDARNELSNYIRGYREMIRELEGGQNNQTTLLRDIVKKKKIVEECKQHLMLAMHVQTVLQKPNNFSLFEMEQVKFRQKIGQILIPLRICSSGSSPRAS